MIILEKKRSENARTYAIRVLLYNIVHLELPPGSAVSGNELSAILSISRTPVREALIELNRIGLVEILPQRGSYISKIDYNLVEESRFLRLVTENAVLKILCEKISFIPFFGARSGRAMLPLSRSKSAAKRSK